MSLKRTCRISWNEFIISDQEIALLEKLAPSIGWEKFPLPLPTVCPLERKRRKFPFKNYLSLFKRKDSKTGETIISSYPTDSVYAVYSQENWWNTPWDPLDYGKGYDPTKTITEQIDRIWKSVPVPTLDNAYRDTVNSEYINGCGPSKDCYLTSNSAYNEKCLYGWFIFHSTHILDANYITESEYCSHSQHLSQCYNIHFSWDTSDTRDGRYLFSCNGCQYVLGWVGLKNQKYQILNTPCSEEEYHSTEKKLSEDRDFRIDFEKKVQLLLGEVWLEHHALTGSHDSSGDFCYESKNALECYNVGNCEDVLYITDSFNTKDSAHISMWWDGTTLSYDSVDVGLNISEVYFSTSCWEGSRMNFYSHKCNNCQFIFGCSGLRNKSYCIFNKEYTKDEWEETVKKIIKQMQKEWTWGEYLDPKYAPFAYNESLGNTFSPLTKNKALERWFRWSEREETIPEGITKVIPWDRLPDTIREIPDEILQWAIKCPLTNKYFQIQPIELELCRKFGIAVPKIHPITRIQKRLNWDSREFSFEF